MLFFSLLILSGLIFWAFRGLSNKDNLSDEEINKIFKEGVQDFKEFCVLKGVDFNNGEDEQSIVLKEPSFDISRIKEYKGEEIKSFRWIPENFSQFIGQSHAKDEAKTIIKKAHRGMKCHAIFSAIQGHGKTVFCKLLAKELKAHYIHRIGKQINEENLVDIINEINGSKEKFVVLFIDEIDSMDKKVIKILNPIIEEFEINNKKIKPFLFLSATINKDILYDNNPDTLDRIPHHIQFKRYTVEQMTMILKQYKQKLYEQDNVPEEIIKTIAENCKFNPRLSLALLEDFIVEQDIVKILRNKRIVKDGLTKIDIKILKVLLNAKKPMGENAVALRCGLKQRQYKNEFEPFLYEFGYLDRLPSRVIADRGREILKEIENDN